MDLCWPLEILLAAYRSVAKASLLLQRAVLHFGWSYALDTALSKPVLIGFCHDPALLILGSGCLSRSGFSGCHPAQGLRECGAAAPLRSGDRSPFAAAGDGVFRSPRRRRLSRGCGGDRSRFPFTLPSHFLELMAFLQGFSWGCLPASCGGNQSRLPIMLSLISLGSR